MTKLAIIDGDGLVYATGAVCETVSWWLDDIQFTYKSEANAHCDEINRSRDDIERKVDAQHVSHALNAMRQTLNSIMDECGATEYEIYLSNTDGDNFRSTIYPEYKANRKKTVRPVYFGAIRKWLVNNAGAVVTRGLEPDDLVSIRAHELRNMGQDCIIVTNDKDMKQIPGWSYNWATHKTEETSIWDAAMSVYTQVLTGDSIDNIKGCPGIGPAKARAAFKDCTTENELLAATLDLYKTKYDTEEKATEMLKLNAMLVRLLVRRPKGYATTSAI